MLQALICKPLAAKLKLKFPSTALEWRDQPPKLLDFPGSRLSFCENLNRTQPRQQNNAAKQTNPSFPIHYFFQELSYSLLGNLAS